MAPPVMCWPKLRRIHDGIGRDVYYTIFYILMIEFRGCQLNANTRLHSRLPFPADYA